MKTIWIVHGSTGEYSDRSEWNVVAVETEEMAQQWVKALDIQYQSIPQAMRNDRWDHEEELKKIMSLDPDFSMDSTGTHYFIAKVPFSAEPPAILSQERNDG